MTVKREIDYAMSVRCRYVVQLLDFVSDDEHVVIVWELIEGSDLLDLLNDKGGRLNERDAAFYFCQLHQAISFIHSNGLVHRDLKPANLRGIMSHAMVLAATSEDGETVELLDPPTVAEIGQRVVCAGFEGEPDEVLNPKKKVWDQVVVDLFTDEARNACFRGVPLTVNEKPCTVASISKGTIK